MSRAADDGSAREDDACDQRSRFVQMSVQQIGRKKMQIVIDGEEYPESVLFGERDEPFVEIELLFREQRMGRFGVCC